MRSTRRRALACSASGSAFANPPVTVTTALLPATTGARSHTFPRDAGIALRTVGAPCAGGFALLLAGSATTASPDQHDQCSPKRGSTAHRCHGFSSFPGFVSGKCGKIQRQRKDIWAFRLAARPLPTKGQSGGKPSRPGLPPFFGRTTKRQCLKSLAGLAALECRDVPIALVIRYRKRDPLTDRRPLITGAEAAGHRQRRPTCTSGDRRRLGARNR